MKPRDSSTVCMCGLLLYIEIEIEMEMSCREFKRGVSLLLMLVIAIC